MSNERSASDPNLIWNGHEVNHQWSKGVAAEGLLRAAVTAHAGLTEPYFSLLRSLSELHIAQLFARYDRVRRRGDELQQGVQAARPDGALVRRLPEVPVRVPGHGAGDGPGPA